MKNYMMYAISAVHFRLLWIFESMKAFRQVNVAVAGNGNHSSYISKKKKKKVSAKGIATFNKFRKLGTQEISMPTSGLTTLVTTKSHEALVVFWDILP